jgi:BspA type Leucine rich repeat region (6 copies)
MRDLLLSALLLASAFQTAVGQIVEGQWTYIFENGGATITASTATGAVTIPSVLGGYAVKQVGPSSPSIFGSSSPNTSVTSVVIPNSVTSIGNSAFYGCTSLTSLTIPNSVAIIEGGAFAECTGLTTLTIPNGVTSIENSAFFGCTGLTSVTIPNSVTSIENNAFGRCTSLRSIIIPNGVIGIASYAFARCSGLESVTFPTSLTTIENNAFEGCTSLRSIIIPNGVGTIGNNAFLNCTSLTSITIPDRYIAQIAQIGISGQVATDYLVNALANNDAFVTAVANKIKTKNGNYGLSTQSGLSSAISTAVQPLATKAELTSSLAQSRTDGINSVLSNPNLWTLYTTSQIQNMAVGDLVLTRQVSGGFVLNYDIEQSTDLQTWTPYQALSLPLTGLPTDKAFVRIKAKQ